MSDELKPCPFCGGKAEYNNDTGPDDDGFWHWYECTVCGAKADSVANWNRRPGDDWQLIETAPKDGTEILGYETRTGKCDVIHYCKVGALAGEFVAVQSDSNFGPGAEEFGEHLGGITHWMPLPKPPS